MQSPTLLQSSVPVGLLETELSRSFCKPRRAGGAGPGRQTPGRAGGPPETLSSPPPNRSATVALGAAARPSASRPASLSTITCNPDRRGPAYLSLWQPVLGPLITVHPQLKHLPDVGKEEEARCGEADVSAQASGRRLGGEAG